MLFSCCWFFTHIAYCLTKPYICSQLKDDCLSATTASCPLIESLVLMSCPSVGSDGLLSLHWLPNLTYLDLSYTFLETLEPVFESCSHLKVTYGLTSVLTFHESFLFYSITVNIPKLKKVQLMLLLLSVTVMLSTPKDQKEILTSFLFFFIGSTLCLHGL